jgi:integrase
MKNLQIIQEDHLDMTATKLVKAVMNTVSPSSAVKYKKACSDFFGWWASEGYPPLDRGVLLDYKAYLMDYYGDDGVSAINLRLTVVKKIAHEAIAQNVIDEKIASGLLQVKGLSIKGSGRGGQPLSESEAQKLLDQPDKTKLSGIRDQALIAVMLGSGLRRGELVKLTFEHIQIKDGRYAIIGMMGKGKVKRDIPIASWSVVAIEAWSDAAELSEGLIFRSVSKGGVVGKAMTTHAIWKRIKKYNENIRPHDLRHTFADIAYRNGADLRQIQLSLGHSNLAITERYLSNRQSFETGQAPCDFLGLNLG